MVSRVSVMFLLCVSLGAAPTFAQDQNPARRGQAVAERRCAGCHAVRAGEATSPSAAAASFARVAATPGMTELALQAMLQTSHRTMPNLILDADDMRDVIAYILSLARR
jgi:mono/diheme cytochrome c family protein